MPATTSSQATHDQDKTLGDMDTRLAETKEKLKKVMETMEDLRRKNEELKHHNVELNETTLLSHNEQLEGEVQSSERTNIEELEKKKLHDELHSFVNKYEEMTKKIGGDHPRLSSC